MVVGARPGALQLRDSCVQHGPSGVPSDIADAQFAGIFRMSVIGQILGEGTAVAAITIGIINIDAHAYSPSQERRSRMILEQVDPTNVAAQCVEALVSRLRR